MNPLVSLSTQMHSSLSENVSRSLEHEPYRVCPILLAGWTSNIVHSEGLILWEVKFAFGVSVCIHWNLRHLINST